MALSWKSSTTWRSELESHLMIFSRRGFTTRAPKAAAVCHNKSLILSWKQLENKQNWSEVLFKSKNAHCLKRESSEDSTDGGRKYSSEAVSTQKANFICHGIKWYKKAVVWCKNTSGNSMDILHQAVDANMTQFSRPPLLHTGLLYLTGRFLNPPDLCEMSIR